MISLEECIMYYCGNFSYAQCSAARLNQYRKRYLYVLNPLLLDVTYDLLLIVRRRLSSVVFSE